MRTLITKSILMLLVFAAAVFLLSYVPVALFASKFWQKDVLYNFLFFFILTLITYPMLGMALFRYKSKFMALLFGSIFFKLFLSVGYILLVLDSFKGKELMFVLAFFLSYILFTGFEVYLLLLNLRQIKQANKNEQEPNTDQ